MSQGTKLPSGDASEHAVDDAGERLFAAFETGVPIAPLSERQSDQDIGIAYRIQTALRRRHEAAGRSVTGRKIGLTSEAMRQQLGVAEPDLGLLFDSHTFASGVALDAAQRRMIAPRLEAELGFVLPIDVRGPGVTMEQILAADPRILPVFEIIDSRIADWRITLFDTVADNASCYGAVVGEDVPVNGRDLAAVELTFRHDGDVVASGRGDAVMGNPAAAVAWLANMLATFGEPLRAGELVLSGSFTAAVDASPGRFEATFGGLGDVVVDIASGSASR